jgi:hypothetical protein
LIVEAARREDVHDSQDFLAVGELFACLGHFNHSLSVKRVNANSNILKTEFGQMMEELS